MTNHIEVLRGLRERLVRINRDTDGDNHINESCDALDELDAALAAMGGERAKPEELVIGAARVCGGEWFRELTWRGVMFLAPLDEEEKARHALTMPLPPPPGEKVGG